MTKKAAAIMMGIVGGTCYALGDRGRREKAKDLWDRYGRIEHWTDLERRASDTPQWTGAWTRDARFLAGALGGALAYWGIHRGGLLGPLLTAAGMGLVTRGASNRATRTGFGVAPVISQWRRRMAA